MIIAKLSKYAAVSALALGLSGAGAMAESLKLLSSWASNQATYRVNVETFVAKVEEYTNGDVEFSIIGPESISPLEQVEPLQTGIVDLVFSHPAYHAGTSKIGMGADGIAVDPQRWRETGIFDAFDAYYQTLGIKVIGIMPLGESGFRFVTNQAVDGRKHSFDGMKVRANASYINIIEQLGGSPVPLSGGEIYSSLQNGRHRCCALGRRWHRGLQALRGCKPRFAAGLWIAVQLDVHEPRQMEQPGRRNSRSDHKGRRRNRDVRPQRDHPDRG